MRERISQLRFNKGILLRVLADVLFINVSLAGALLLRFLIRITWEQKTDELDQLTSTFTGFYSAGAPLLTGLALLLFYGFGVYTRTRFYARRHKVLVLLQAISLSYLLFVFCSYFVFRDSAMIPRGVFVLSYAATLLLSGGMRLLKHFASRRYTVIERRGPALKEIRCVLVVGGAGYIGSVLVRQLLSRGYQVRVLDAAVFGSSALADLATHSNFELIEGDIRHVEAVVRSVKNCDAVIHLGGLVGDPACELDAQSTREINTVATKLLIQVCRGYGVQRLLFASTCAVYGASEHLMDERSAISPVSSYAHSKADAEEIVLEARGRDFCPVVLRLGTVFGASFCPRFDLVVNLLVAKAWREKKILIYNKHQWRPFVHVHDIARAFCLCLQANAEVVSGEVFNVGSYQMNLTLGEVAEQVKTELPDTAIEFVEIGDPRNYRVSFDKIHTYLGFSCEKSLRDGIRELRSYLEQEPEEVLQADIFDHSKRMKALSDTWLAVGTPLTLSQLVEGSAQKVVPAEEKPLAG
ncbi:MAG: NAD-dependent epimerase/dehydratase family protein [Terriglobia bacterium]